MSFEFGGAGADSVWLQGLRFRGFGVELRKLLSKLGLLAARTCPSDLDARDPETGR